MPRSRNPLERPQPILHFLRTCEISNKDLAKAVGYSETYCSQANRGVIRTSPAYRQRVSDYLELSVEVLFDTQALAESSRSWGGKEAPEGARHFRGYDDEVPKPLGRTLMTNTPRAYELWSFETGNCTGVYATLDEALDIVAKGVAGMSRAEAVAWVGDLALVIDTGVAGEREAYAEATELLDIALDPKRQAGR